MLRLPGVNPNEEVFDLEIHWKQRHLALQTLLLVGANIRDEIKRGKRIILNVACTHTTLESLLGLRPRWLVSWSRAVVLLAFA